MKQLTILVAGAAIGLGGCSSMGHHYDGTASSNSDTAQYAREHNAANEHDAQPAAYTEGGTAKIEDHRNDAVLPQPGTDRQEPTADPSESAGKLGDNQQKTLGDED